MPGCRVLGKSVDLIYKQKPACFLFNSRVRSSVPRAPPPRVLYHYLIVAMRTCTVTFRTQVFYYGIKN